jgi:DNA-binding ferritin-like protein
MASLHNHYADWRQRAKQARALAQKLQDPAAKSFMSDIAERYDRLASRAESDAGLATAIRHFDNC